MPEGWEFEGGDQHPGAVLSTFLDQLNAALILSNLFVINFQFILAVHSPEVVLGIHQRVQILVEILGLDTGSICAEWFVRVNMDNMVDVILHLSITVVVVLLFDGLLVVRAEDFQPYSVVGGD